MYPPSVLSPKDPNLTQPSVRKSAVDKANTFSAGSDSEMYWELGTSIYTPMNCYMTQVLVIPFMTFHRGRHNNTFCKYAQCSLMGYSAIHPPWMSREELEFNPWKHKAIIPPWTVVHLLHLLKVIHIGGVYGY